MTGQDHHGATRAGREIRKRDKRDASQGQWPRACLPALHDRLEMWDMNGGAGQGAGDDWALIGRRRRRGARWLQQLLRGM